MDNIAIVVTFNKKSMLNECLQALLNQSISPDMIVVLDNGSTDGTREYISSINDKRIHPILLNQNLGGAGGFNRAIKEAMLFTPNNIWIMDDDSIVDKNALRSFITAKNKLKDNFGFLSGNVLWTDGTPCLMNIPGVDKIWTDQMSNGLVRLNRASFVSMYVNTDAIRKVGYPISDFFLWGDDIEFSQRVSKKFPSYFVPDSVVVHKMGSNNEVNILTDEESRIPRYFYDVRNKFYRFRCQGSKELIKFILQVVFLCLKIIFKKNSHKLKKIKTVLKGFFAGIIFRPRIEYVDE